MVYFQTKIAIWVNFGGSCKGICWFILWPFAIFGGHLVYFLRCFGMLYQEKYGNPSANRFFKLPPYIYPGGIRPPQAETIPLDHAARATRRAK
jgi:hypothetical protein